MYLFTLTIFENSGATPNFIYITIKRSTPNNISTSFIPEPFTSYITGVGQFYSWVSFGRPVG